MATDLEQVHFRFRTDGDAADATPSWGADEDTNYDPGASPFRLRMGLANLGDASSGSLALYLQKNAGSYAAITTASTGGVKSYDASSDADDTPIRIPRLSMSAEWRLAGAAIDLDLAGNRIYPSGAFTDYLSCSRASIGYAKTAAGALTQFASDTLRRTDLGLLIEAARTNYLIYSQEFTQNDAGEWSVTEVSVSGGITAPDATATAYKLTVDTNSDHHGIQQGGDAWTPTSGNICWSVYSKAAGYNFACLSAIDGAADARYSINVNLTTGEITDTHTRGSPTLVSSAVEVLGNGWYRLEIVLNSSSTNNSLLIACSNSATPSWGGYAEVRFLGDGSSGIYVWGAQLEMGSFASSYIPTTTTSAARAADNITIIGGAQTDIAAATASIVIQVDNGAIADVAANIADSNGTNLLGFDASNHGLASITATLATGDTANRTTQDKLGIAWDASGRSLVLNGGTVATDATAQTPSSTQHLGSSGTDNFAFAYIERLTVWTSKLADATLQGLTS